MRRPTTRAISILLLCALLLVHAHTGHDHDHGHDHDDHHGHDHDHHGHDHDDHHGHDHGTAIDVDASSWDTVAKDPHVWVVKFHSLLCSSCKAFAPEWEAATESMHGLHWASVNIDEKKNLPLAERFGVLQEGIPNVKIMNAAEGGPLPVVTGDVPNAKDLMQTIERVLADTGAATDEHGWYRGPAMRSEL